MFYHRRTFERLLRRAVPTPDPALVDTLPPLPASVREWYSLPESVNWLAQYSNGDWAIHPKDFDEHIMTIRPDWRVCFAPDLPRVHRIADAAARVFLVENQGVCWWAFTDQQDDPPVYVTHRPPPEDWRVSADCFSTFIYTRVFDHIRFFVEGLFHTEVTDAVPESTFNYLGAHFESEPTTRHLEGWEERRYSRGEQRVTISGQLWLLSADTPASFQSLGRELSAFLEEFPQ
jgi:hypothetical protein